MMFWNRNKKEKAAAGNEKNRFDHLLSVAEKLPVKALPDLLRAIVRPVQSDFLLPWPWSLPRYMGVRAHLPQKFHLMIKIAYLSLHC